MWVTVGTFPFWHILQYHVEFHSIRAPSSRPGCLSPSPFAVLIRLAWQLFLAHTHTRTQIHMHTLTVLSAAREEQQQQQLSTKGKKELGSLGFTDFEIYSALKLTRNVAWQQPKD